MTVSDMRQALISRYSNVIRNQNVDFMPDRQVIAIYRSLIERKDLDGDHANIPKSRRLHEPVRYEQMRMDI